MKHIIWDFNGTLLCDAQLGVECDNHVFDTLGLPRITISDYRRHMTMPVRDFYTALGVDLNIYKYETISRIWLDMFNQHAVDVGLVPGVLHVIAQAKALGYTQSILSASYEKSLLEQCTALGLVPYMEAIGGLGDESAQKKTDIGRKQMAQLGLEGRETVLIGDMVADSELAGVLGVGCILVPWGHNDEARLAATGRDVARSCEELIKMLAQMR
ncbi:MAG: HAD family hydrolase [Clostridia bacterium]|nr:HAD family hydrolase [Clostridia bacterium]